MGFWDVFRKPQNKQFNAVMPPHIGAPDQTPHDLALAEALYANTPHWLYEDDQPLTGTGLGALIAAEVARLVTIESKISVDNDEEIDGVLQKYVVPNLRVEVEKGWALGGVILKPYYLGAALEVDARNRIVAVNGGVKVDFIYPSRFLITGYDASGAILGVKFFTTVTKESRFYTLVETQTYDERAKTLTIANEVFRTVQAPTTYLWDNLGTELVELSYIEQWQNLLPKITFTDVRGCLIGFYKPALANNKNVQSQYGASGLVRAAGAIKRADLTYNTLDWEVEASQARLYIDEVSLNDTSSLPKKLTRYIVKLLGAGDKRYFEKYSPDIRDASYLNVYNAHLRQVEDTVGLSHGTLSDVETTARTATEIAMSKQRTYAMVVDNQKALETAVRQLVYAIGVWRNPNLIEDEYEMMFDFDDSIVANPVEQVQIMLQLQAAGNIPAYRTNMSYFNASAEDAQRMVEEAKRDTFDGFNDIAEMGAE